MESLHCLVMQQTTQGSEIKLHNQMMRNVSIRAGYVFDFQSGKGNECLLDTLPNTAPPMKISDADLRTCNKIELCISYHFRTVRVILNEHQMFCTSPSVKF